MYQFLLFFHSTFFHLHYLKKQKQNLSNCLQKNIIEILDGQNDMYVDMKKVAELMWMKVAQERRRGWRQLKEKYAKCSREG